MKEITLTYIDKKGRCLYTEGCGIPDDYMPTLLTDDFEARAKEQVRKNVVYKDISKTRYVCIRVHPKRNSMDLQYL